MFFGCKRVHENFKVVEFSLQCFELGVYGIRVYRS